MRQLLFAFIAITFLGACNKYEDGPALSLRTKTARLCNRWQISSAYQNGVDKTSDFNAAFAGYLLEIRKDETYALSYSPFSVGNVNETGHWAFNNEKTHVIFTNSDGETSDYTILKLKEKELWVRFMDGSDEWEIHLVPKS